ncbi:hypothetical protein [Cryobacterium sp. Y82]|uniref:hypothetical protein n=1 Tax=Cryobacterium sp. Y82 TaxID=2045017 RepID=UPI001304F98D|nr:hypothetical protein [Cryobacterium sp. Y82]
MDLLLYVSRGDDEVVTVRDDGASSGSLRRRRHRDEQRRSRTNARAGIVALILAGLAGMVTATAKPSTRDGPFPGLVW